MKIDNSQMQAWWYCPMKWEERYANNLEPRIRNTDSLRFGTRMHQLLEIHHMGLAGGVAPAIPPLADEALEAEAQMTFEAYCAFYPEEPFEVIAQEQYFEIPLGRCADCSWAKGWTNVIEPCEKHYGPMLQGAFGRHTYNGEFDGVVRQNYKLYLLETKTESRSSKSNLPEAWISRSQVGLYQWAAEQIYGEEFEGIILNVITRQSPKGNCGPLFRRDHLHRTREQQLDAVKNLVYVADEIERMQREHYFPSNRNNCVSGNGWKCDFFDLHVTPEGRPSEELIQIKFKPAEKYLAGL